MFLKNIQNKSDRYSFFGAFGSESRNPEKNGLRVCMPWIKDIQCFNIATVYGKKPVYH